MTLKRNLNPLGRARPAMVAVGVLVVIVALVSWGGTTRPGPLFALGVGVLLGLIALFVGLGWWLLASPLPPMTRVAPIPGASRVRALAAAVAASGGLLFVAGGLWDEIWHRRYGGFGDDFLWPPHLLLYSSIALIAALAVGAVLVLALSFRGPGGSVGLRERVRAEPLLGLIALVSAFLIFSLPSDELWHRIYGRDITAWSLPHMILVTGIAGVMLASVPLALSSVPRNPGRFLERLRPAEIVALVLVAWATSMFLQIGTAEWEGLRAVESGSGDAFRSAFWQRPEWLYPVVILSIALFCARVIQAATGRVGVASLVGLLALAFRLGMMLANDARDVGLGFVPHVLILPAMLALDAWVWLTGSRSAAVGNLVSASVFLAVALPALPMLVVYPRVNATTLPGMIVMGLIMGLAAGAAGSSLGGMLGRLSARAGAGLTEPRLERREGLTALAGLCLAALVVLVCLAVASPPTR